MTAEQKVAIARIVYDIIKADDIIDLNEMNTFAKLKDQYNISYEHILEAQKSDFFQAVEVLKCLDDTTLCKVLADLKSLTMADGDCAPEEAMLVIALEYALAPDAPLCGELLATDVTNLNIEKGNVIYVETTANKETNNLINNYLRLVSSDFAVAGLNFVFIPKIADDFCRMDDHFLHQTISFLAPSLRQNRHDEIFEKLRSISTVEFTNDFLKNRMELDGLHDCESSLFMQVGQSNGKMVYMVIPIGCDGKSILHSFELFLDRYKELTHFRAPIFHRKDTSRFIYHGFHKSLFDLLAFPGKKVESRVCFNLSKGKVSFLDLGVDLRTNKKALAIYMLIVHQSFLSNRGELRKATAANDMKEKNNAVFRKIYSIFSGTNEVDYTVAFTPNLSRLRAAIESLDLLDNMRAYVPESTETGFRVLANPSKFYVLENGRQVPILESSWTGF